MPGGSDPFHSSVLYITHPVLSYHLSGMTSSVLSIFVTLPWLDSISCRFLLKKKKKKAFYMVIPIATDTS